MGQVEEERMAPEGLPRDRGSRKRGAGRSPQRRQCREDDARRNNGKREDDAAGVSGDSGSRTGQDASSPHHVKISGD